MHSPPTSACLARCRLFPKEHTSEDRMIANGPPMFSFLLPDGQYVGRRHHNTPWQPSPPGDARCYTREEAEARLPFFRAIFPECSIAPSPRWNPNTRQYEIPSP